MDPNSPTAASLAQYLESHGYTEAAQVLRKEAKVAKAEEIADAASNNSDCTPYVLVLPSLFVQLFFFNYLYNVDSMNPYHSHVLFSSSILDEGWGKKTFLLFLLLNHSSLGFLFYYFMHLCNHEGKMIAKEFKKWNGRSESEEMENLSCDSPIQGVRVFLYYIFHSHHPLYVSHFHVTSQISSYLLPRWDFYPAIFSESGEVLSTRWGLSKAIWGLLYGLQGPHCSLSMVYSFVLISSDHLAT